MEILAKFFVDLWSFQESKRETREVRSIHNPLTSIADTASFGGVGMYSLARIIRKLEDKRSLLCYKHVD